MVHVNVASAIENGFPSKWIARQFEDSLLDSVAGSSSVCISVMEIDDRLCKAIAVITSNKQSEVLFTGSLENCEHFADLLIEEWG